MELVQKQSNIIIKLSDMNDELELLCNEQNKVITEYIKRDK